MMKHKLILILAVLVSGYAQAQQTFGLKECIDYALKNNTNIQNAMLDTEIAENNTKEMRSKGLPQLDAGVDLSHSFNVQKIILENGVIPAFTDPSKPNGEVIAFQLQLQNTLTMSASARQVIYDRSLFAGLKNEDTYKQLSLKNVQRSQIDIIEGVTKAYYGLLVAKSQLDFLNKNVNRVDTLYQEAVARFKSGIVRKIDVDRIEVRMNNLKEDRDKSQKIVELNLALLRFQMNYPSSENLDVTGTLDETLVNDADLKPIDFSYNDRIEYSILQSQSDLNKGKLDVIKGGYTPRLSAFATSGYNPASTYISDIFQSSRYFNYTFVGLKLEIPIFHGFEKKYKVSNQVLENRKLENNIHNAERSIDLQVQQAHISLSNGMESLKTQKRNLALAEENVKVIRAENKQGIATNLEVTNAETDLKEAQSNYYNALYTVLIAKTDLMKATGKLQPL
jgi:outer membrane protein